MYPKWHDFRKCLIVALSIFEMVLFSGYLFGFHAFIPVYIKAGLFSHLCSPHIQAAANSTADLTNPPTTGGLQCDQQRHMLYYAFIVWTVTPGLVNLPIGYLNDRFGLRATKILSAVSFGLGAVLFGKTSASMSSLVFLAGIFATISCQSLIIVNTQSARLFPQIATFLVGIFTGSFDSSSAVFTVLALAAESLAGYSRVFMGYAAIGASVLLLDALFLFPKSQSEIREMSSRPETAGNNDDSELREGMLEVNDSLLKIQSDHLRIINLYPTIQTVIRSKLFLLTGVYYAVLFLFFNFYTTSLHKNISSRYPPHTAGQYLQHANYFMFCGILIAPLAGLITDSIRQRSAAFPAPSFPNTKEAISLQVYSSPCETRVSKDGTTTHQHHRGWYRHLIRPLWAANSLCVLLAMTTSVLSSLELESLQYLTFLGAALFRAFLFSTLHATLVLAFPSNDYGLIFGMYNVAGCLVSALQYLLILLVDYWSFSALFVCLLGWLSVALVQPIFILWTSR